MEDKCKVIAIANQKGGVGKTTTAVNLGVALGIDYFSKIAVSYFSSQGFEISDDYRIETYMVVNKVFSSYYKSVKFPIVTFILKEIGITGKFVRNFVYVINIFA